jgi:hypothetical protein
MVFCPEHKLELVMIFLVVCFSFSKFITPVCIEFCICLKLGKILFSRVIIDVFSLPLSRNVFEFACVCLLGRAQGWFVSPCVSVFVSGFWVAMVCVDRSVG